MINIIPLILDPNPCLLEYLSNEKEIINDTLVDLMKKVDDDLLSWSIDQILDNFESIGLPTAMESENIMSLDEAINQYNTDKSKSQKDKKNCQKKKSAETKEEKFDKTIWKAEKSYSHQTDEIQTAWNRVLNAMQSLKLDDSIKEQVAGIMSSVSDESENLSLGLKWKALAEYITERERELQKECIRIR